MSETRTQTGGINIEGPANVGGDMVTGDKAGGDKVLGNKIVQEAAAPIALNLHQLPAPPIDFVGREQEIADILRDLDKGVIISGVHGMGGIGKTALALVIANQLKARYPDAQFFVNLRGASDNPMSAAEAMAHIVRAYYPTSKLPDDGTELQGLYCSVLEGKKALVLMDNAKDAAQITPLLPPATCLMLITSRQHFAVPGLRSKDLNVLPADKACELLISIADRIGKCADDIAKLCGYLPQALRAAASLIAATIDLDPTDYLDQLRDEHKRLENIGVDPNRNISVEASLNLSYASLSAETQRVFGRLAVFPASFDAAAEEVVCEDTDHVHLSQLVKLSLVQYDAATKRYSLHDLARLFADARLSDDEHTAAQRRHAEHYMNVLNFAGSLYLQGGYDISRGLASFDLERNNIETGQAWTRVHSSSDDSAAKLCSNYTIYLGVNHLLSLRLHPRDNIHWVEAALSAARYLNDRKAEGIHLSNLGIAYKNLGETRKAIKFYEQALKIKPEIGDRLGEGNTLGNLGIAYAMLGETRKAIEYHEQALKVMQDIGDRRAEGAIVGNLGLAYAALGETRKAIEYHEQALKVMQDIGDRRGEGNVLGNLGLAYAALGETHKAMEFYEQHRDIAREIGDRRGEANALMNTGNAYYSLGEFRHATEYHDQALVIFREIGDRRGEGQGLGNLGIAYENLGERQRSIEYYQQALDIAHAIGDRRGEGNALGNLGVAYKNLGETRKAIEFYEQQLEIVRENGDRRGEGNALFNMSLALDKLGEREKAIACAETALKIYGQIEDPWAEKVRRQLAKWKNSGQ